jgi:hypothetical protein
LANIELACQGIAILFTGVAAFGPTTYRKSALQQHTPNALQLLSTGLTWRLWRFHFSNLNTGSGVGAAFDSHSGITVSEKPLCMLVNGLLKFFGIHALFTYQSSRGK